MYKKIKKQNGERFAQTLRDFHNGILEIPNIDVILRYAGRNAEPLLPYLMTLIADTDDTETVIEPATEDPFVLLGQAGYDAFYADTLAKQNSIKPHFAHGELLCTFNDAARHENYHIVHAIKTNVDDIKREDFRGKEERQDAYGTSVISIQMLKSGGFISIKNRYNHTVKGCDHTFDSNPDNIIDGLSAALRDRFNVEFTTTNSPLPDGYALIKGQVFQYHNERNNIYYGDQVWAWDGVITTIDRSRGDALFDQFVFDNTTKTLKNTDPASGDSFANDFNLHYGGNRGLTVDKKGNLTLNGTIIIGAEQSRIKTLHLPGFTTTGMQCLQSADALTHVDAPDLVTMNDRGFCYATGLIEFNAPELTKIGKHCFRNTSALEKIKTPKLEIMGDFCFCTSPRLTKVSFPALLEMGNHCFRNSSSLECFEISPSTLTGVGCLQKAPISVRNSLPRQTLPSRSAALTHLLS